MIHLAILARDEADRLPALAERTAGLIGGVAVLVDNRTNDDTAQVAELLWGDLPGGCDVALHEFDDFASARNRLVDFASTGLRADDYLLILDPDSLPDGDLPEELSADIYTATWRWGGEEWPRVILLRVGADAHWEGAVHENLVPGAATVEHLPGVIVDAVVTAPTERVEWIADVLREDAAVNPRSAFYLAQTLLDLGRRDEAFGWYLRRAAMGHGWREETYLATYLAGCVIEQLDWQFAQDLWRRAARISPTRAEPYYQLARAANQRGDHSEALALASLGLRSGPTSDTLRVNRWIEREGLIDELNTAAAGMGALLSMPHAPLP